MASRASCRAIDRAPRPAQRPSIPRASAGRPRRRSSSARAGARVLPSSRSSFARGCLARPDERRADMLVVIGHLAIEAEEALIHIDLAASPDRAHRAQGLAEMAGRAAFGAALQKVEEADAAQNGQAAAERAGEAAIEALDEKARAGEQQRIDDHRPFRHEAQDDRCLEGLDLRARIGEIPGDEGRRDESEEQEILHPDEALLPSGGNGELRQPKRLREPAGELLQRAIGTEPAAIDGAAPEEHADEREEREDRDERIGEQMIPAEIADRAVNVGDEIEHGELRARIPAEPDERPGEKADPEPAMKPAMAAQPRLPGEDRRQRRKADGEDADLP